MNDRELLERAAKAAGYDVEIVERGGHVVGKWRASQTPPPGFIFWQPLREDGDALRLAVRLHLSIEFGFCEDDAPIVAVGDGCRKVQECLAPDFKAKTRRAIVRAAAELCP